MRIYQVRLLRSIMRISEMLEGEMTTKQMGTVMILYMAALAVFGVLAVIVIHGLGWQWL